MTALTPGQSQDALRRYAAGESAGIIANSYAVSRNVISGLVNRAGIKRAVPTVFVKNADGSGYQHPSRPRNPKPKRLPKPTPAQATGWSKTPRRPTPEKPPMAADVPTVALLSLRLCHCKWPIGDPKSDAFGFCGQPKERGAYCSTHAARAYVTVSVRDHRRKAA